MERLDREVKRRTDVIGMFPNHAAVIRLTGAVLSEKNDEWQICRKYVGAKSLAKLTDEQAALSPTLLAGWPPAHRHYYDDVHCDADVDHEYDSHA